MFEEEQFEHLTMHIFAWLLNWLFYKMHLTCLSQDVDIIWGWRCHYDLRPIDFIWIFMTTSGLLPRVPSTFWEKVKRISSTFAWESKVWQSFVWYLHCTNWTELCLYMLVYLVIVMKFSNKRDKSERIREVIYTEQIFGALSQNGGGVQPLVPYPDLLVHF